MGIDIGGNTITQAASALTINTGVSMTMLSTGGVLRPKQPQFIAAGTGAWGYIEGWYVMPFNNVLLNVGACYDGNSRFTAPVTGWYFFQVCTYLLKDHANDGYYFHPVFAVNGDIGGRAVNPACAQYRIRSYGENIATYTDGQITQAYALVAGDYVEHKLYSSGGWNGSTGNRHYGSQSRFTGFLLG